VAGGRRADVSGGLRNDAATGRRSACRRSTRARNAPIPSYRVPGNAFRNTE